MLPFLSMLGGGAGGGGLSASQTTSSTAGPATARGENWFTAGGDFNVNSGALPSWALTAAAIAAMVLLGVYVVRKK